MLKKLFFVLVLFGLMANFAPIRAQENTICWIDGEGVNSTEGVILPYDLYGVRLPRTALQPEQNYGVHPSVMIESFDSERGLIVFAGRIYYGRDRGNAEYDTDGDGVVDTQMGWDSPDEDTGIFLFDTESMTISSIWLESDFTIQGAWNVDLHPADDLVLFEASQFGEGTGGDSEIFVVDFSGNVTQITENLDGDYNPRWFGEDVMYARANTRTYSLFQFSDGIESEIYTETIVDRDFATDGTFVYFGYGPKISVPMLGHMYVDVSELFDFRIREVVPSVTGLLISGFPEGGYAVYEYDEESGEITQLKFADDAYVHTPRSC